MKVDPTARKAQISEAYLGHRLSRTQISALLKSVDEPQNAWDDRFESMTAERVPIENETGPVETLRELGLAQRFETLDDNTVWSAEDRAVYRRLSKLDAPVLQNSQRLYESGEGLAQVVEQNFEQWNRDGDTALSESEIDFLMSGGFYGSAREMADNPDTAAGLATLLRNEPFIAAANPNDGSGITRSDLLMMREAPTDALKKLKASVDEDYTEFRKLAEDLPLGKPLSEENIDPSTVHQGVVGSCVLLSTLAGSSKETLTNMLNDNQDGTYSVLFADGVEERVTEPTVAERLYHAKGEQNERWPALFELALAQRQFHAVKPSDGALRSAIDGIEPEVAIKAMTGREADHRNLNELSVNATRQAVKELTSGEGPVICGSRPVALSDFISVEELKNGIHNGHCYTVLGYDGESDKVTLRNPWGRGEWKYQEGADDGVFEMPMRDFYSSFRWMAGAAA